MGGGGGGGGGVQSVSKTGNGGGGGEGLWGDVQSVRSFLVFPKKIHVWHPFPNFIIAHKLVPLLLAFSSSDVNGNVWPKLITTK